MPKLAVMLTNRSGNLPAKPSALPPPPLPPTKYTRSGSTIKSAYSFLANCSASKTSYSSYPFASGWPAEKAPVGVSRILFRPLHAHMPAVCKKQNRRRSLRLVHDNRRFRLRVQRGCKLQKIDALRTKKEVFRLLCLAYTVLVEFTIAG